MKLKNFIAVGLIAAPVAAVAGPALMVLEPPMHSLTLLMLLVDGVQV